MRSRIIGVVVALGLLGPGAEPAGAQVPGAAAGGVISGVAYDSLAEAPLTGALVQLVDLRRPTMVARSAVTDARGRYAVDGVPDGRYQLGFLHPVLDSLGLAPWGYAVTIEQSRPALVDLAVPSAARLRAAYCTGSAASDSGAVLVGIVRRADDQSVMSGARVRAEWLEYAITPGSMRRDLAGRTAVARATGWFALCNVPRGGTIVVSAEHGADSSGRVEVEMPERGFLRRDLSIGAERDGRLRGVVVAAQGDHPLVGAVVGIPGGPETRTDAQGEWVLSGVPTGTRTLEVRAIGFMPRREPVDVVAGSAPVRVALFTMRAMLDTVRVRASRFRLAGTGFDERRRSGAGQYMTAEYIARRRPSAASDLFRMVPGVRLDRGRLGETHLTVRGPFGRCVPALYIDGHHLRGLSTEDIDGWAHPDDIAGIEIYSGAFVPPEFQEGMTGCGSIVIWTKPFNNPARRWSWPRRAAHGAGAILLGAGLGMLLARM